MINEIQTIYHYCSVDTFMKILTSNSIYLTHSRMLNDKKEDRIFLDSITTLDISTLYSNDEEIFAKEILACYKNKVDFPYIACFSKDDDILNQWISYGDNGKGVAIGFDLAKIPFYDLLNTKNGDSPLVMIDEVKYSNNDSELIQKIISAAMINYRKYGSRETAIQSALSLLDNLSIYTKSTYFSQEQEVRMVYNPCYRHLLQNLNEENITFPNSLDINFMSYGNSIKSYFKYTFAPNTICSLTLGPQNIIDYNQLTLFLNKYAPNIRINNTIKHSKISYHS